MPQTKEKTLETNGLYQKAHRKELNEWAKEYRRTHPEWTRAAQQRA